MGFVFVVIIIFVLAGFTNYEKINTRFGNKTARKSEDEQPREAETTTTTTPTKRKRNRRTTPTRGT